MVSVAFRRNQSRFTVWALFEIRMMGKVLGPLMMMEWLTRPHPTENREKKRTAVTAVASRPHAADERTERQTMTLQASPLTVTPVRVTPHLQ